MNSLTVGTLDAHQHHGADARVTLSRTDIREGALSFARNPSYLRRDVYHWWLLVPSTLRHFTRDALSLQWAGGAAVQILLTQERAS